jgi:hypothetical protein
LLVPTRPESLLGATFVMVFRLLGDLGTQILLEWPSPIAWDSAHPVIMVMIGMVMKMKCERKRGLHNLFSKQH